MLHVDVGRLQVAACQHLQLHATYANTVSVVPPEDGRFAPETCRGFKTLQSDCENESVLSWFVIVKQHYAA
jgi:hypothetical protein